MIPRKVIQGNCSDQDVWTQAVLMSIDRTNHSRQLNPVDTVKAILRQLITVKTLPALATFSSDGS